MATQKEINDIEKRIDMFCDNLKAEIEEYNCPPTLLT